MKIMPRCLLVCHAFYHHIRRNETEPSSSPWEKHNTMESEPKWHTAVSLYARIRKTTHLNVGQPRSTLVSEVFFIRPWCVISSHTLLKSHHVVQYLNRTCTDVVSDTYWQSTLFKKAKLCKKAEKINRKSILKPNQLIQIDMCMKCFSTVLFLCYWVRN